MAEYSWERKGDDLDFVHFECGGEDQGGVGIFSTDYSFKGDWDAQINPVDPTVGQPPGVFPRDDLANVSLVPNQGDTVVVATLFLNIPLARVLSARVGAQVRQKVTYEASGKSNGGVVLPTGSVA